LELPNQWIWDILDEFIYQFESFCRFRVKAKSNEALQAKLAERPDIWDMRVMTRYLNELVRASRINEQLAAQRHGEDVL
jgi:translation initiation factor 3 subunit L